MEHPARFKTDGERWLATYFEEVRGWAEGLVWEYEPLLPGKRRRPDFRVESDDASCMLEVKDFGDSIEELPLTLRALRPYRRIRCKLNAGRKQLDEYRDEIPCALVLRPGPTADTDVTSPVRIMEALIGPLDRPSPRFVERFSVLGAVLSLRWRRVRAEAFDVAWSHLTAARGGRSPSRSTLRLLCEALQDAGVLDDRIVLGVTIHENPNARHPFPSHLFRGPFDECWTWTGRGVARRFCGTGLSRVAETAREVAEELRRELVAA
jgi:hypothetical protein